jgi:hypothetical protein
VGADSRLGIAHVQGLTEEAGTEAAVVASVLELLVVRGWVRRLRVVRRLMQGRLWRRAP